jgi:hypothetical protein
MYAEVARGPDTALKRFLVDRRRKYNGRFAIFARHETAWRKALVATLGRAAAEFSRLLAVQKGRTVDAEEAIALSDVERAISHALATPATSGCLWHACACYAFLRCMYGVRETPTTVVPPSRARNGQHSSRRPSTRTGGPRRGTSSATRAR